MKYQLINKALYLPEIKTLVFGDLHLGHEFTFREPGSFIPETQIKETKKDMEDIFKKLKKEKQEVEKVVFLGDIKHFFSYEKGEKNIILDILLFIGKYVKRENIILLKGNHEKIAQIADKKFLDYFIEKDVAFIHGDIVIKKAFEENIKTIVMGHLHPAINLIDSQKIKKEKYKCYLIGKYKEKEVIILPSFLPTVEGLSVNEWLSDESCIIPEKVLRNFKVHVVGKNKIYDFGVLRKLK